jgi:hypothetical protein
MVHEPVHWHIVHLFTAHSVNFFFEFQIIVIYLLINKLIEHLTWVNLPKINSKTLLDLSFPELLLLL